MITREPLYPPGLPPSLPGAACPFCGEVGALYISPPRLQPGGGRVRYWCEWCLIESLHRID